MAEIRFVKPTAKAYSTELANFSPDVTLDSTLSAEEVSEKLLTYIDEDVKILAPITSHYCNNRPLFIISIPKSGTHLLFELARVLGYRGDVIMPAKLRGGSWYCLNRSDPHTSAKNFFIEMERTVPFGNRQHPFNRYPALFGYRNPMDVVVSEANFMHKRGMTAFYNYYYGLEFEERLLRWIQDDRLMGSIRDRMLEYAAWFEFPNVIPISFEELIGEKGGGDAEIQRKLIWSLQLKLHVPGRPEEYGAKVFNPDSYTFVKGAIGGRKKMPPEALEKFMSLPQDFMEWFGYDSDSVVPKNAEKYRKRSLLIDGVDFSDTPIMYESDYCGCKIIRYKGRFYGVPHRTGITIGAAS